MQTQPHHSELTSLTPGELRPGMIAWAHGMRVEIVERPTLSKSHAGDRTFYTTGIVTNRSEVSPDAVPYGFTNERYVNGQWVADGRHYWTFQGNDRARVCVEIRSTWVAEARELGTEAAETAASWTVDGNTDTAQIPALLELIDAGDPSAEDYFPAMPNLSGEWADSMTPIGLYELVTGRDHAEAEAEAGLAYETLVGSLVDELADAWEDAVGETFQPAVEAELRKAIA